MDAVVRNPGVLTPAKEEFRIQNSAVRSWLTLPRFDALFLSSVGRLAQDSRHFLSRRQNPVVSRG
jgi:hypothetical protein